MKRGVTSFFKYARLRHSAYLAKQAGVPKGQQSKDPILNKYSFTNVFRELDKTTVWFREHVRDPLRDKPEVMLATVLFRLLNRIEVGEAIFCHDSLLTESSAFYELVRACESGRAVSVRKALKSVERAVYAFVGVKGPHATGSYIISSPPGQRKLPGILSIVEKFCLESKVYPNVDNSCGWQDVARFTFQMTLEDTWSWLKQFEYFGPFHSYEIVTDLRHTALLDNAPDIMTWANPGPGARRGANRVMGRDVEASVTRDQLIEEMREVLAHSRDAALWPKEWPKWEMRDAEHSFCEWDKYERTRLGEGRPRGVYR